MAPSTLFPHLPPGFPPQQPQQFPTPPCNLFVRHAWSHPHPHLHVHHSNNPQMWGPFGSFSTPPLGVLVSKSPHHHVYDMSMFRAVTQNPCTPCPLHISCIRDIHLMPEEFLVVTQNYPPPHTHTLVACIHLPLTEEKMSYV